MGMVLKVSKDLTVICWATDSYKHLAKGLQGDCKRLGYPFHMYYIDGNYSSLVKAWCNHPKIVRRGINDFGKILFLDAECRILRPIPDHWKAPLIAVRKPAQKFWIKYNSGTVLADENCIPWVDTWIDTINFWDMENLAPNDFIHWPGDICDELALSAALAACKVELSIVELEYVDRKGKAEISRGNWFNEYTIIQHPTTHHWSKESDPIECKKLFWQNYPGNPEEISEVFESAIGNVIGLNGWVFDTETRTYAPEEFWRDHPRLWIDEQVYLTSAQK